MLSASLREKRVTESCGKVPTSLKSLFLYLFIVSMSGWRNKHLIESNCKQQIYVLKCTHLFNKLVNLVWEIKHYGNIFYKL